jgi:SAM-dependent methyltransferase
MNFRTLLALDDVPVYQNKMFATAEQAKLCPRGSIRLVQDPTSGITHNSAFDASLLTYDQSYQNEQGFSPAFQSHLDAVLALITRHFSASTIMEVGCGKGAFLEAMRSRGLDAFGIDPAYEGHADYILKGHFGPEIGIKAGCIVMRHTLEHIADPARFLRTIRDANCGSGLIYIEVPCMDWVLSHNAWFDVFYEHVNYFRLADFNRLFGRVIESGRLFGGQYLYAIAELGSLRDPATLFPLQPDLTIPKDFFRGVETALMTRTTGSRHAIWGAAAKGVMFAHHASIHGITFDFAIDINPAKQGKFLAGSGLQVLSPDEGLRNLRAGDDIFVMNTNYLHEITRFGGDQFNYITVDQP